MKLATIEKVLEKSNIEGVDRIELIKVLGWSSQFEKATFKLFEMIQNNASKDEIKKSTSYLW